MDDLAHRIAEALEGYHSTRGVVVGEEERAVIDKVVEKEACRQVDLREAACCIWEALLDDRINYPQFDTMWENEGSAGVRMWAVNNAERCEKAYLKAKKHGFDDCYDWTFVPKWLHKQEV